MRPTFWQRLDAFARHQVPVVVTLILMLITVIPSHTPGLGQIGPMLSLISVYYWAVYRPDLMGYGAVFAVGLLEDTIAGTPLGVGSLMLLLVHGAVVTQYKFFHGKSFAVSGQAPLYAYLMTVALYPVIGWMLVRLHLFLVRDV
jgi:rod shape-determining protein MreD